MFTGLVSGVGEVVRVRALPGAREFSIRSSYAGEDLPQGASVAVQGVCLTLIEPGIGSVFKVRAGAETLRRSVLGRFKRGDRVHLELALRATDRLGGHLVQGHVDGVGRVRRRGRIGGRGRVWGRRGQWRGRGCRLRLRRRTGHAAPGGLRGGGHRRHPQGDARQGGGEGGGDVTYHGPGQLVGYPVLDLRGHGQDLHRYLRTLEAALIGAAAAVGVAAGRIPGKTGVWIDAEATGGCVPRKLASIGVHVSRWVAWHGFALNVTDAALSGFDLIVPCGLAGVRMTALSAEAGRPVSLPEAAAAVRDAFAEAFGVRVTPAAAALYNAVPLRYNGRELPQKCDSGGRG